MKKTIKEIVLLTGAGIMLLGAVIGYKWRHRKK